MSEVDSEAVLTVYAGAAVGILSEEAVDGLPETLVELGDKNEYTAKLYTLLCVAL